MSNYDDTIHTMPDHGWRAGDILSVDGNEYTVRSVTRDTIRLYSNRWTGRLAARLHRLWIWLNAVPFRLKWWIAERWYQ